MIHLVTLGNTITITVLKMAPRACPQPSTDIALDKQTRARPFPLAYSTSSRA